MLRLVIIEDYYIAYVRQFLNKNKHYIFDISFNIIAKRKKIVLLGFFYFKMF